ncbi:MAG: c-type cytochrome [Gaiellaceae bacterium]
MRFRLVSALAALSIGLLAGCGGDDSGGTAKGPGASVFAEAGCGSCHTFEAAGSNGSAGPNLDDASPSFDEVVQKVKGGGGGMPSFEGELSEQEIQDVARFVSGGEAGQAAAGSPVIGPFKANTQRLEGCLDADCRRQAFGNIAFREGPKPALELFEEKQRSDKAVEADCHRIAHTIGSASLQHHKGRVAQALTEGRATCWSGYYHGVVEHAFFGTAKDELPAKSRSICVGDDIRRTSYIAYQCVHGLGHGLMIHTGYDLTESLRVCDLLTTDWDRTSCHAGVFMENVSSSYGIKSRWLRDDDLIYPCNEVATRHKYYCYLLVTSRILPAVGGSLERTAEVCRQSEAGWVEECFESFGRDASGIAKQNGDEILPLCRLAGANESDCIYGAARDIANNDADGKRAARFCDKVRASARAHCFEGVGTILGGLHTYADERRAACAALTTRYLADCARGAGLG